LKSEGVKKLIAEVLGWSESKVKKHSMLLENVVPEVLEFCKKYQIGRGTEKVPNGTFNFTEGRGKYSQKQTS